MIRMDPFRWRPKTAAAFLLLTLLLPLLLTAPGCATNPVTGERQLIIMSTKQEKEIDEQVSKQIEQHMGLVDDPALSAYVDEVGQALAAHSPRQDVRYSFHVLASDEPNAFALPGGHIYVSRGLLALTNSEAELANVLGHEIGHVAARHAAQRDALQKIMAVMNVVGMVGVAAGGASSNGNGGPVGTPGPSSFSREHESEADVIGQDLAVAAGVDPMGMADLLDGLDASSRLVRGYSNSTRYFDTHPAARERAARAATRAEVRRWTPRFAIASTRAEYLERLEGLSVGTPATEGVIKDERLLHPELGIAVRFPPGWKIENTRGAVYAVAPGRDAVVALELEGPGDDPEAAALGYAERNGVRLEGAQRVKVGSLDAYHARGDLPGPVGRTHTVVTWIAHEGLVYRLSGLAVRGGGYDRYAGVFRGFPRGFKELTDDDRELIEEVRLRVVEAEAGETLSDVGKRSGNSWSVNETAVRNRMLPGEPLDAGDQIKIAVSEPYQPERERPEAEPESRRPAAGARAEPIGDLAPPSFGIR
jgi:predicted Zn-dependent protease